MTVLSGDQLVSELVPLADRLVAAVHAMNADEVRQVLTDAAWLAGSSLAGAQHLAVVLAGMCSEDHVPAAALGWTANPAAYHRLRDGCDALTASLRAARTPEVVEAPAEPVSQPPAATQPLPPEPAATVEPSGDFEEFEPRYDEAAVRRCLAGDRTVPLGKYDRREVVRRAWVAGMNDVVIERHTGISARTALRIRQRLGLPARAGKGVA